MAWKELCIVGAREQFVLRALEKDVNFSALCREAGISRKTGYKWLERYKEKGLVGLDNASRRPNTSPLKVSAELATLVVKIRVQHPTWGARKIRRVIELDELTDEPLPSERTINRILTRSGLLLPRRRRKKVERNGPTEAPRLVVKRCNDVWTVDFKGWWLGVDSNRIEPLTVRDAHSRYILGIQIMTSTKTAPVKAVFEELFKTYGIPKAILTDNGTPFVATNGRLGLTQLSAWWAKLGIEHVRTRLSTPSDNGGHERMHKDIAAEIEVLGASLSRMQYQEAVDRWRHDFNLHRPHEAIGMKRPGDIYKRSEVEYRGAPDDYEYPKGFRVVPVNKRGQIWAFRKLASISHALHEEKLGLKRLSEGVFDVYFRDKKLGKIDLNKQSSKIEPVFWIDEVELLPMGA